MYFLKTKGTGKIPDYIQMRDENFVLIKHFKAVNPVEHLQKMIPLDRAESIAEILKTMEYGELKHIEF